MNRRLFVNVVALLAALLLAACSREYNTELMNASKDGDLASVKAILARGADIDQRNNKGKTALMFAVSEGNTEVTRFLILQGADVDAVDQYGTSALIVAATAGHGDDVAALLEAGADISVRDESGGAPLVNAVYFGHVDAVKALLGALSRQPAGLEKQEGEELLLLAAGLGHGEIVQALVKTGGVDVNGRGLKQRTALMAAAYFDKLDVARILLELGADPALRDVEGNTALDVATERGSDDIVPLLRAG